VELATLKTQHVLDQAHCGGYPVSSKDLYN